MLEGYKLLEHSRFILWFLKFCQSFITMAYSCCIYQIHFMINMIIMIMKRGFCHDIYIKLLYSILSRWWRRWWQFIWKLIWKYIWEEWLNMTGLTWWWCTVDDDGEDDDQQRWWDFPASLVPPSMSPAAARRSALTATTYSRTLASIS